MGASVIEIEEELRRRYQIATRGVAALSAQTGTAAERAAAIAARESLRAAGVLAISIAVVIEKSKQLSD